jgi:hypothetical protein
MSGREPPDPDEIADRIIVDTPVLDRLQQTNLPLRGRRREQLLQRIRFQVKQRRTSGAVAQRVANLTIGTLTESIDSEGRRAVEENVQGILEDAFDGSNIPDIGDE